MLDPEIKKKMEPFTNEPEKWNKIVFYICMLLIVTVHIVSILILPRVIGFVVISLILAVTIRLVMIGSKEGEPITGWRKFVVKVVGRCCTRAGLFLQSFLRVEHKYVSVDYSEWLGPDWKAHQPHEKPPIIIANHQSWSVCIIGFNQT